MTPTDRASYKKLAHELAAIATRLKELSDAGFDDMEGADAAEFRIAETLYCLEDASEKVAKASMAVREECEK